MNRTELVERIIPTALRCYGIRVTNSMFGDWLREKLIATPGKQGRKRNWTAREYRVALEICRLKSQGVNFAGAIKWHLWIKGFELPKFDPQKHRRDLLKEFRKFRALSTKSIYTTHDPRSEPEISVSRARAIARSVGTQDERLHAILPFAPEESFDIRNLTEFDVSSARLSVPAADFLNESIRSLFPSFVMEGGIADTSTLATTLMNLFGGLTGQPDEIVKSGEASVLGAGIDAYLIARVMMLKFPELLLFMRAHRQDWRPGLDATARSLRTPQWRIGTFVSLLHAVHRAGPLAAELFDLEPIKQWNFNTLLDIISANRSAK